MDKSENSAHKIALFGGSFNPPHYGHLALAKQAFEQLNLDQVVFIPTGNPPHKKEDLASAKHRYAMTKLAIADFPRFAISPMEIRRKGKSYTYRTIINYRRLYPQATIYFLLGLDSLSEISNWIGGEKLLKLCTFIVGVRENVPMEKIKKEWSGKIEMLAEKLPNISATAIRRLIRENKPVDNFLPIKALEYIKKHDLYREGM
ncbi:MAG: nicotinate-nucleotide adenylyltransferase [Elusimicrobiota bacterium]